MSNFKASAIHPKRKNAKLELVEMIDNGPGRDYTVRFSNGDEFPESMVDAYYPQAMKESKGAEE